jgi:FAD/FMN-containing dehydrogenase
VAFPRSAADVEAALAFCRREGLPLTARGAGSGMAGNNVGRGLLLDFTRHLHRVLDVAPSGVVRAEPGATYDGLNRVLQAHGRVLPPNPSSGAFCTLGGMVANNASGMRSVKYGPTAAWLVGARGLWGTGDVLDAQRPPRAPAPGSVERRLESLFADALPRPPAWIRRVAKNSAGLRVWPAWNGRRLNVPELLAGSEGTLALFTELRFRTAPLPGGRGLVLAAFGSLDDLVRAVDAVGPLRPSGVEFLDRTFLDPLRAADRAVSEVAPPGAEAVLFVEVEGGSESAAAALAREALEAIADLALPGARLARTEDEARGLWAFRRGASPALVRRHPGRVPMQFVEDCAVPPGALAELLRGLRAIFDRAGVPAALFGHAGQSHVHANPLFDADDPVLPRRIEAVAEEVCGLVERLGGTLSGEHGDGLARAAFAARRFGPAAEFFAEVRRTCDPDGVLNPGKILPAPGWSTGRDLRHPWERRLLGGRRDRRSRDSAPGGARKPGPAIASPGIEAPRRGREAARASRRHAGALRS